MLLMSIWLSAFSIQPAKPHGTIYIETDRSSDQLTETELHEIAIMIKPYRTVVDQNCCTNGTAIVENQGNFLERINVSILAASYIVRTETDLSLAAGERIILKFVWNTTKTAGSSLPRNCTLSASASPVPGEANVENNNAICNLRVSIKGDIDANGRVDITDVANAAKAFRASPGATVWNPEADVNENEKINIVDIAIIGKEFGKNIEKLLRVGFAWPIYADPAVGSDECSTAAICNLYDPLVFPVPKAPPKPWVAQNWTVTPDGLNYTFNLKSGIMFHSGRELTAPDVEFSLKRLLTIGQGYSYLFAPYVKGVQARSTYQVEFVLNKAFGPFISALIRLYIVDKQEVLAHINHGTTYYTIDGTSYGDLGIEWLLLHDAGSGAYEIVDAKMEQWFKFALVPYYWGEVNPNAPTTVIQQWTEGSPATEKTMMLNKELEVTDSWLPAETLDSLDREPYIMKVAWPDVSEYYFMLNCMKPPLDDVHVRKALAYCFDYQTMITEIYSRHKLATSCVPESVLGYLETQTYYYNVTKAQEELKLSKYYPDIVEKPDNYAIEFHWVAEIPERERDALLLAENALALGLKVNVVKTPWLKLLEEMTNANLSAHIYDILVSSSYPEAGSLIQSRYRTGPLSWESNEKLNNSTLDALIDDALATTDSAQRFAKYAQIQRDIMAICPSIFLYDYYITVAIQDYVKIPAVENPAAATGISGYDRVYKDWQVVSP
jgi:peptide/nickel transport system substrate-binding protein